jgi:hypothetical protein
VPSEAGLEFFAAPAPGPETDRRIAIYVIGNNDIGVRVNAESDEPAITVGDRDKYSLAFPESIEKTKVWLSGITDDCLDPVPISLDSPNCQNSRSDDGLNGDHC